MLITFFFRTYVFLGGGRKKIGKKELVEHRSRVIGAHPTISDMKGWFTLFAKTNLQPKFPTISVILGASRNPAPLVFQPWEEPEMTGKWQRGRFQDSGEMEDPCCFKHR